MSEHTGEAYVPLLLQRSLYSSLVLILMIANNQGLVEKVKEIQKENKKTMKLVAGFLMIILAFIILAI